MKILLICLFIEAALSMQGLLLDPEHISGSFLQLLGFQKIMFQPTFLNYEAGRDEGGPYITTNSLHRKRDGEKQFFYKVLCKP